MRTPPAGCQASEELFHAEFEAYVDRAVRGEPRAVEHVLRCIHPLVVRYCRARLVRGHRGFAGADDLAQEVCLAVLTALPTYRDQGRPFVAFAYGIAAHKLADCHRAAGRRSRELMVAIPEAAALGEGPEQHLVRTETVSEIGRLLRALPRVQREIVVLRVINGLSAEQTARAVGSTPGAVRSAQHRALTRLRLAIERNRHASIPTPGPRPRTGRIGAVAGLPRPRPAG